MRGLHRTAHEAMFWSRVTYDPAPIMIVPESALMRGALMEMREVCGFRWEHDDDVRLLAQVENAPSDDRLALGRIGREIMLCRTCLDQTPVQLAHAKAHHASAQSTMRGHFKINPPSDVVLLLRQVGEYLERS